MFGFTYKIKNFTGVDSLSWVVFQWLIKNELVFYPFTIKASKCSGTCNNISDPYAKICVPDVVNSLHVKVFNLMSRTNET